MSDSLFDDVANVQFRNELTGSNTNSYKRPTNSLSSTTDSEGGKSTDNLRTIREILGPNLESIDIIYVTSFETRALFQLAQSAVSDALQKSPRTLYRYSPWANAVAPDFVCKLHWKDGKTGELAMTYGYICFQDHDGTHWWSRFTMPSELNLASVRGTLGFQPGRGYYIDGHVMPPMGRPIAPEANGGKVPPSHHIWLQVGEDKVLVQALEKLVNKPVSAVGELKKQSQHVTGSVPSGENYLAQGFKLAVAKPDDGKTQDPRRAIRD